MLGSSITGSSAGSRMHGSVQQIIDQLLVEEREPGPIERRTAHRQPFIRPVTIQTLNDTEQTWQAFSKNVSEQGIGLITTNAIELGTIAKLTIHRPTGYPVELLAECRWCDPFGEEWHLHGWNFINVARSS